MDPLLGRAAALVEGELSALRQRARAEEWDTDRREREKAAVALRHDVTLCSTPGCMSVACAVPGFEALSPQCPACAT